MAKVLQGHASTDGVDFPNQVLINEASNNWHSVFRATDINIANKIADCAVKACQNEVIGYSQGSRYTLRDQVADKGYDPSKATSTCYCDCSSLVELCCFYAGVPIGYNTTRSETDNLLGTGKFQKVLSGAEATDVSKYQRGDILLRDGHTAVVVSINGDEGLQGYGGGNGLRTQYSFPTYTLTDEDINRIANLCCNEQETLSGRLAVASVVANVLETNEDCKKRYGSDIIGFMLKCGRFKHSVSSMLNFSADPEVVSGVRDVLVNGNRTLPLFVNEYDKLNYILVAQNGETKINRSKRDEYIQDQTIISTIRHTTYKFWCFPDEKSAAFGYTDESLRRQWEQYLNPVNAGVGCGIQVDWTRLKPYILYVDRFTKRKLNYTDLMYNHGVIGVMIEGGSGFEIEGFRNPNLYDQVRECYEAGIQFGYVLDSTSSNIEEANKETENIRFLVSHYAPPLGVWVRLNNKNSKDVNDQIFDIYERDFVKYGLKNKIGVMCTRKELTDSFTWLNYQENWFLWLIDPVLEVGDIKQLLDPQFFDTDGKSGPIRGANGGLFQLPGAFGPNWGDGTTGPDEESCAACLYAILHAWGIPDNNICGLIGCYSVKTRINAPGIEGDNYFFPNQAYKWTEEKQKAIDELDNYTKRLVNFRTAASRDYQDPADGHWYAGLGMIGLPGVYSHRLLEFASKIGANWYTVECQTAYLLANYDDGGMDQSNWLRSWTRPEASPALAVQAYYSRYEKPNGIAPSSYAARGVAASRSLDNLKQKASKYSAAAAAVVMFVKGGCKAYMPNGGMLTSANTQAVDMFALGDQAYNEASPTSSACQQWIEKVAQIVLYANRNYRVKTSLIIATIIVESGWMHTPSGYTGDGSTLSENNNVMGINDYPELTVPETTWYTYKTSKMFNVPQWDANGNIYYHQELMKTYKCVEDCVEDFIGFLCKNHPEFKGNNNLEAYADWLQHYTPNPHQRTVDHRRGLIDRYGLEKYDNMTYQVPVAQPSNTPQYGQNREIDFLKWARQIADNDVYVYGHFPSEHTYSCSLLVGHALQQTGYIPANVSIPTGHGWLGGMDSSNGMEAALLNNGFSYIPASQLGNNYSSTASMSYLQPGDVMYRYNNGGAHTGFYAGNGQFIESRGGTGPDAIGVFGDFGYFEGVFRLPSNRLKFA